MLKTKTKKVKIIFLTIILALFICPAVMYMVKFMEGEAPSITLTLPYPCLGKSQDARVDVSDSRTGIKKVWVVLYKDGRETVLIDKTFPSAGFLKGGEVHHDSLTVTIEPAGLGLSDGKAVLRMAVQDYAWRRMLGGNRTYEEREILIDTKPPEVDVLSKSHNLNQGGAGIVIYRVSEEGVQSGVAVGDNFFPGYSGYFNDKQIFMAFFALSYLQGSATDIFIKAEDQAGNTARAGVPYFINARNFKKDTISIPDSFLRMKMPEFEIGDGGLSLLDKFLLVNSKLRKDNAEEIKAMVQKTDAVLYWQDSFLRLPGAAPKAGFADSRSYVYDGRIVDHQVHLGVDLASLSHSPVPAANTGKVIFSGAIGIYGKTVILDHGFGLFSMYSHLSRIDVQEGQKVQKGGIIGHTGMTGLAGGDHLHFSMLVHNTFVNPLEWWDAVWIKNNIADKIDTVKQGLKSGV